MKARLNPRILLLLLGFLAGCHSTPEAFQFGAYSEAERLYAKEEYRKAIEKYEEYLGENPEGNLAVIAAYYMAKSYQALGQREPAAELYRKIVREHSKLVWAKFAKERLEELRRETS